MKHRFVVCDVDGTLLQKGESVVDDNIIEEIRRLVKEGVHFCVASGRSYAELEKLFSKVKDLIYFVCLDGAVAIKDENIIFGKPLKVSDLKKISDNWNFKNEISLVLYGRKNNYHIGKNDGFLSYLIDAFNENVSEVLSLSDIKEDIYKVSLYGETSSDMERMKNYITNNRLLKEIYDDGMWHDYIGTSTDKKEAVSYLQKLNNIKYEETAVFGDNVNDMGLLRCGLFSFAMKNGSNEIKRIAKFETDSVLSELKKF